MEYLWYALTVAAIALLPRAMVLLSARFKALGFLGPVFLCYAGGFLLSLALPDTSLAPTLSEVLVPIAIPLILFSADPGAIRRYARPLLLSFGLMCASVALVSTAGFFLFRSAVPDAWKLSGMMMGLYTGGTPNLMAIGSALGVGTAPMVLANTMDMVVGGIYFLVLVSAGRLARRFLPVKEYAAEGDAELAARLERRYAGVKLPVSLKSVLGVMPMVLLAVGALGVSAGAALLITGNLDVMVVMLGVTSIGVACSFIKRVRRSESTFAAGKYFIYMFSVALGMSFDLGALSVSAAMLLLFFAFVQFGSAAVHLLLARVFRIDADTTVIASTAGVFGPAFIIPVANSLKNDRVILPGLLCGILGYAIGNYLGIGLGSLLALFG